jgi:CRP/FNR family transcriptional regulator
MMSASIASFGLHPRTEDVLAHLPVSGTSNYGKGRTIYSPQDLSKGIHLVVAGKVGVSHIAPDGGEVLLDIVRPDELFGESAFLAAPPHTERAIALEDATLMTWAIDDIEGLVMKRPRLAVALLQIFAERNVEFTRRIQSYATDGVERRIVSSLLRFSTRLGTPQEDGWVRMMPVTHAMLAQYVGSTRSLVTHIMSRFRRLGYVSYSRHGILLRCEALQALLQQGGRSSGRPAAPERSWPSRRRTAEEGGSAA